MNAAALEGIISTCLRKYEECCRRRLRAWRGDQGIHTMANFRRGQKHHHEALKWLFKWRDAERKFQEKMSPMPLLALYA